MFSTTNQRHLISDFIHQHKTLHVRTTAEEENGDIMYVEKWYINDCADIDKEVHITVNWLNCYDEIQRDGSFMTVPEISCFIDTPISLRYQSYVTAMSYHPACGRKDMYIMVLKDSSWNTKDYIAKIRGKRIL